jgi:hypothetical protein
MTNQRKQTMGKDRGKISVAELGYSFLALDPRSKEIGRSVAHKIIILLEASGCPSVHSDDVSSGDDVLLNKEIKQL